jgi:hypothetical protein
MVMTKKKSSMKGTKEFLEKNAPKFPQFEDKNFKVAINNISSWRSLRESKIEKQIVLSFLICSKNWFIHPFCG